MTSLQRQSDSAFQESDSMDIQQQRAAEDARINSDDYAHIEYADGDEGEDYPPPEPLESDGQGLKKATDAIDFAEDETASQGYDALDLGKKVEKPQRSRMDREDIHAEVSPRKEVSEGLSESMLDRARGYGFNPNDIKSRFRSDEDLEKALLAVDQQMLIQTMQPPVQPQPRIPMQQQPQPQPATQPPPVQPPQPGQPLWEPYKLRNPDLYDEQLAADLNGLSSQTAQYFQTQAQELQATRQMVEQQQSIIQQFLQQQQQQERSNHVRQFDQLIQGLGPEWEEVFGLGEAEDLDPNSYQMFNRRKALQTVDQLRAMHQGQGRNVRLDAVLPSSLQVNFPGRQITKSPPSDNGRTRDSQGRFTTAKPTSRRRDQGLNPRESILRRWDKVYGGSSHGGSEDDEI